MTFRSTIAICKNSEMKKIGGVIVSHGQLANELLAAAETVVGDISHVTAVSIGWHDDVEMAQDQVQRAIASVSDGAGVLVMTDMFGGTPTNIAAMFLKDGEVEIVTGVNLPMVIKLASNNKELSLSELAREVESQGKQAIYRTGALLEPHKPKKDA
jgi:mannose PTS system EIIA component